MSTDKLQALHNTVSEILSEPPAPPTFFDEEPGDAAPGNERVAKTADNLQQGAAIPKGSFGKLAAGEDRASTLPVRETQVSSGTTDESLSDIRQAMAAQVHASLQADKASQGFLRHEQVQPDSGTANTVRRWGLRGIAGVLLAGIGVVAFNWLGSSGNTAKTAPTQPAPVVQSAPAVVTALPAVTAASPELTPLVQAMSRDLANLGKEIEQLKAERASMVRENANQIEQLKAGQEKLTRAVAEISEQLKTGQEQMARDRANANEQMKAMRDQLDRVSALVSDQNARPKIAASPPRPPRPDPSAPRADPSATRKPAPAPSSAQAAAQPKPRPPSTSRPPAPPTPATPAR